MFEKMLFRYRIGDERSINAFMEDKLYFSTPEYFNDPFDSYAYVNYNNLFGNINFDLDNSLEDFLEKNQLEIFPLVTNYNKEYLLDLSKNKSNRKEFFKNIQEMVADVSKKITQNSKIICFSEEYLSNLMWAHYANYHQGFLLMYDKNDLRKALVFDSKNEKLVKKLKLKKVTYSDEMYDFGEFMYGYLSQRYNKDILKIYIPMLLKMLSVKTITRGDTAEGKGQRAAHKGHCRGKCRCGSRTD